MLTKNFYNAAMATLTGLSVPNGIVDHNGTTRYVHPGQTGYLPLHRAYTVVKANEFGNSNPGIMLGSGTTPPTKDDYVMESPITKSYYVANAPQGSISAENGRVTYGATFTITNTDTVAISISEIGYYGFAYYNNTNRCAALFDRAVLDVPIVINPGESKPITYSIAFNYPVEE